MTRKYQAYLAERKRRGQTGADPIHRTRKVSVRGEIGGVNPAYARRAS